MDFRDLFPALLGISYTISCRVVNSLSNPYFMEGLLEYERRVFLIKSDFEEFER